MGQIIEQISANWVVVDDAKAVRNYMLNLHSVM